MFEIPTLIVLIPALPLLGTIVTAVFGPKFLREQSHLPVLLATIASFLCSVMLASQVRQELTANDSSSIGYEQRGHAVDLG